MCSGDPLNDKKGCLFVNGGQIGAWIIKSGFPKNSQYWEMSAYVTGLNAYDFDAWQGIKGVKASVGDNYLNLAFYMIIKIYQSKVPFTNTT